MIPFDGQRSCDPPSCGDRHPTNPIVRGCRLVAQRGTPEARKQDLAAWARAVLVANLEADRAEACLCIGALLRASGPALQFSEKLFWRCVVSASGGLSLTASG